MPDTIVTLYIQHFSESSKQPYKMGAMSLLIYKWENRSTERVSNLPKVCIAGVGTHSPWPQSPGSQPEILPRLLVGAPGWFSQLNV